MLEVITQIGTDERNAERQQFRYIECFKIYLILLLQNYSISNVNANKNFTK